MRLQVEICSGVYAFKLFESHWKVELNITSCICIMCKIHVIMKPVFFPPQDPVIYATESFFSFQCSYHSISVPGFTKKLHLHLFKLPHSKK